MSDCPRDDEPNAVHHLTNRVNWQRWLLQSDRCAETFLALLAHFLDELCMDLLAYVLMSNHVHLVVRSPGPEEFNRLTSRKLKNRVRRRYPRRHFKRSVLSQFLHRLAGGSSHCIQEILGLKGRFWESEFHSRRVRTPQSLLFTIAYDHLNPVVQHMVPSAADYARSSAASWAGSGASTIPLARRGLPFDLDREEFCSRLTALQQRRELRELAEAYPSESLWAPSMSDADLDELIDEYGVDVHLHH